MAPEPATLALQEKLLEMQIPNPIPNLLNRNSRDKVQRSVS